MLSTLILAIILPSISFAASVPANTSAALAPAASVVQFHPNGNTAKCMDVQADVLANGTPVQIFDCNGSGAQNWIMTTEETSNALAGTIQLAGTNFCLDAGSSPANGVHMKIWTCFAGLPAQDWVPLPDDTIALAGAGLCLDLNNGDTTNSNFIQTWQCTEGDTNQIWLRTEART